MLALPRPATVADAARRITPGRCRAPTGLPARPLVAVNQVHASLDAPVRDGDEVAILPPMAGG